MATVKLSAQLQFTLNFYFINELTNNWDNRPWKSFAYFLFSSFLHFLEIGIIIKIVFIRQYYSAGVIIAISIFHRLIQTIWNNDYQFSIQRESPLL